MKEQIIQIPDNLRVKEIKDNKIIIVEKKKHLTYEDVTKALFGTKTVYWFDKFGTIQWTDGLGNFCLSDANNASTEKQLKKLLAINQLMNVAKYLNGDWQPNWNNTEECKYYITIHDSIIEVQSITVLKCLDVYFKSEELAEQAIEILGEEIIKLVLCTDY